MITGNEPAMPVEVVVQDDGTIMGVQTGSVTGFTTGLTIRQHFAAMAMQGLCANSIPGSHNKPEEIAKDAVRIADLTIAALNNSNKQP